MSETEITYPNGTTVHTDRNRTVMWVRCSEGWFRVSLTRGRMEPSSWTDETARYFSAQEGAGYTVTVPGTTLLECVESALRDAGPDAFTEVVGALDRAFNG